MPRHVILMRQQAPKAILVAKGEWTWTRGRAHGFRCDPSAGVTPGIQVATGYLSRSEAPSPQQHP